MSEKNAPNTAGGVFARRVTEARKRRGWTQSQLAERVSLRREAVTLIEKGKRHVTINEWLAIAAALNVPPLHLVVPLEDDAEMDVGDGGSYSAMFVRAWIRGSRPLPGSDMKRRVLDWLAEWPDSELQAFFKAGETRGVSPLAMVLMDQDKLAEHVGDLVWELKEGEAIRRAENRKEKNDA